ncbi:glycosyltransferase family protein [Clostridium sp. ZBS13]|uniref:glycosyltransferase family protein n=1 Tax=Clostridium sp. ZBS13 TaxID=2949971 RepID=UPI0020792787|nr:glycosyltransferase family protein [Clostridium sp. ZBS13]
MNIGIIVQARVGSTRLPNKVLKYLPFDSKITVLEQDIRRIKKSKYLNDIIIATTESSEDDKIVEIAKEENVKVFRGSEHDVLGRYYFAAKENNIDVIVRVTSDCPCVDSEIIDMVVDEYLKDESFDFVATVLKRTFPIGLDVEVIKFSALEKAFKEAEKDYQREHVTDYIYENPNIFKLKNVSASNKYNAPTLRVTLDTTEDYTILSAIYDFLYYKNENFSAVDVVNLLNQKPWLQYINDKVVQKKDTYELNEEIDDAIKLLEFQGMKRAKDILIKNYNKEV